MSAPSSTSSSEDPPLSLKEFEDLIRNIERFYAFASRLSRAMEKQSCEYLIQESSMAFTKAAMSLLGFLRFIPCSQFFAEKSERIVDLSSASVMARQVIDDVLSFLYLSEPNLTDKQKHFRCLIWEFHGLTEGIESAEFANPNNPDLPATRATQEKARALLVKNPFFSAIES